MSIHPQVADLVDAVEITLVTEGQEKLLTAFNEWSKMGR